MLTTHEIEEYLLQNFKIIYALSTLCPVFLIGGAIRDISLGNEPKNLDFVCLDNNNNIEFFLEKFQLSYEINKMKGYKINYKEITIDLWKTRDLYTAVEYNIDGLFYDVANSQLIPFGYFDALENGLRKVNEKNNIKDQHRQQERKLKLQKYISQAKRNRRS